MFIMNKSKIRIFFNVELIKHINIPHYWTIGYFFGSCDELAGLMFTANKDKIRYKIEYI